MTQGCDGRHYLMPTTVPGGNRRRASGKRRPAASRRSVQAGESSEDVTEGDPAIVSRQRAASDELRNGAHVNAEDRSCFGAGDTALDDDVVDDAPSDEQAKLGAPPLGRRRVREQDVVNESSVTPSVVGVGSIDEVRHHACAHRAQLDDVGGVTVGDLDERVDESTRERHVELNDRARHRFAAHGSIAVVIMNDRRVVQAAESQRALALIMSSS